MVRTTDDVIVEPDVVKRVVLVWTISVDDGNILNVDELDVTTIVLLVLVLVITVVAVVTALDEVKVIVVACEGVVEVATTVCSTVTMETGVDSKDVVMVSMI